MKKRDLGFWVTALIYCAYRDRESGIRVPRAPVTRAETKAALYLEEGLLGCKYLTERLWLTPSGGSHFDRSRYL